MGKDRVTTAEGKGQIILKIHAEVHENDDLSQGRT